MANEVQQQRVEYQTGFAPQVAPYAERLLGGAESTLFDYARDASGNVIMDESGMPQISGFKPYMQYQGERFAGFTPLQQQAFAGAQAMQAAPQLADASAMAGTAGLRALAYNQYQPGQFANFYQPVRSYQPSRFEAPGVGSRSITGGDALSQYMSPYMQNVVDIQQREAQRQADIAATQRGQKYARAGAFGGARQAIENAEAARNLAMQKGDIQAQGLQQAFGQGTQQFNVEQQAAMQAALANQQARMQAQQMAEQSRQYGYGQLMQQAGLGAQYNQAAAQLGEQSRQYGAGLGLQGLQAALQSAQQLGNLGQTQFGQNMALNQLQAQYGLQQQQQMQQDLTAKYQDFLNFQNQPYKQLGFMSDILRGAPLTQTGSTVYGQAPSTVSQLAGLGTAAFGASKLFGMKEGGSVQGKPAGLADLAIYNMGA